LFVKKNLKRGVFESQTKTEKKRTNRPRPANLEVSPSDDLLALERKKSEGAERPRADNAKCASEKKKSEGDQL